MFNKIKNEVEEKFNIKLLNNSRIENEKVKIYLDMKSVENSNFILNENNLLKDCDENRNKLMTLAKDLDFNYIKSSVSNDEINTFEMEKRIKEKALKRMAEEEIEFLLPTSKVEVLEDNGGISYKVALFDSMCYGEEDIIRKDGFDILFRRDSGISGLEPHDNNIKKLMETLQEYNYNLLKIEIRNYDEDTIIDYIEIKKES